MKQKIAFRSVWILAAISFLFIVSCKKNNHANPAGGKYYIKFKADGEQKEFTYNAGAGPADQKPDNGLYTFSIVAGKDVTAYGTNFMSISMYATSTINSPRNFQDPLTAITYWPQITILYNDEHNDSYTSMGLSSALNGGGGTGISGTVADAKASISTMGNAEVKGSFSGSVYSGDDFSKKHLITNGEFYLPVY